jgi:hypothetical protein
MLEESLEPLLRHQRLGRRDQFLPELLGDLRFHSIHIRDWSERRDLNSGPLAPHASALPDCATLRRFFLGLPNARAGLSRAGVMIRRNAALAGAPDTSPAATGAANYRRRTFSSSSSSSLTCFTICWLCETSVRASSPVS